ncbi:MAG: hypothetical protein FWB78_09130 [Treponema sp.]|nr:hypothetical protein [Treponema sp.]
MDGVWTEKQKQGFAFFNENLNTLADNPLYRLKYVIISGDEIKGTYDTFTAALSAAVVAFYKGEYIIQKIEPGDEPIELLPSAMAVA